MISEHRLKRMMSLSSHARILAPETRIPCLVYPIQPCIQRAEKTSPRGGMRPVDAVNMMSRLKQLTRDMRKGQGDDERIKEAMEMCAEISVGAVREMHPKHVSLALNTIKDRSWPLFKSLDPGGPNGVYDQVKPHPFSRYMGLCLDMATK